MKIIYNSIIPFKGYTYINLFGILFGRKEYKNRLTQTTINHESIHSEQYKDLLYIFFLPLYFIEWIIKIPFSYFVRIDNKSLTKIAYKSISFEQEAYYNQSNYEYLNTRKKYNWIKYIFKMYDFKNK